MCLSVSAFLCVDILLMHFLGWLTVLLAIRFDHFDLVWVLFRFSFAVCGVDIFIRKCVSSVTSSIWTERSMFLHILLFADARSDQMHFFHCKLPLNNKQKAPIYTNSDGSDLL